jgi:hypothetical protein
VHSGKGKRIYPHPQIRGLHQPKNANEIDPEIYKIEGRDKICHPSILNLRRELYFYISIILKVGYRCRKTGST